MASAKWRNGSARLTRSSPVGRLAYGMNTLEMNASGISTPFVRACVANTLRVSATTANPSAAQQAMPTTRVSNAAGTLRHTIWNPNPAIPTPTRMATDSSDITIAARMRLASTAQVGTGAPRSRLSIPLSRKVARPTASTQNAPSATPKTLNGATRNWVTLTPLSTTRPPSVAPTMTRKLTREDQREERRGRRAQERDQGVSGQCGHQPASADRSGGEMGRRDRQVS